MPVMKICEVCGKEYSCKKSLENTSKYCSRTCYHSSKNGKVEVICQYCSKNFILFRWQKNAGKIKYCSRECYHLASRDRYWITCRYCGKEFEIDSSRLKNRRYCSMGCRNADWSRVHSTHGYSKEKWYRRWARRRREYFDKDWTHEMEHTLVTLQPACVVCGSDDRITIDHVIPVSKGGRLEPGNAVILCKYHNSSKNNRDLDSLEPGFSIPIREAAKSFLEAWNGRDQRLS